MKITNQFTNIRQSYAFKVKKDSKIDLSLSENPLGCSPKVLAALKKNLKQVPEYPDANFTKLKKAISRRFTVPTSRIIIANGSEALISLLSQVMLNSQSEAVIPKTTFPLFEKGVLLAGAKPVFTKMTKSLDIDLEAMKRKRTKKTRLFILCNPNNPTGQILAKSKIIKFVKDVSPVAVLVDEANIEFGGQSVIREVKKIKNLIVFRTFSKGFGLAGLRIGFAVGPQKLITVLEKIRWPFPCSILAEPAALAALKDQEFIKKSKRLISTQRQFLTTELKKRGFAVIDSEANNILVKSSLTRLSERLCQKGISVVSGSNFRGLNNSFIRISPRLSQINRKFLRIIDEILEE